jgi:exopolysaccharide biosynthesis polyprenyl glycosylphosphotransferase
MGNEEQVMNNKTKRRDSGRRVGVVFLYLVIDILVIFLSFYFVYLARFESTTLFRFPPDLFQVDLFSQDQFLVHLRIAAIMGFFLIIVMYKKGLYATTRGARFADETVAVANAVVLTFFFGTVMSFLLKQKTASRIVLTGYSGLALVGLVGWRILKRKWLEYLISHGYQRTETLIVGAGAMGKHLAEMLNERKWLGINVAGFLDDNCQGPIGQNPGVAILGKLSDFEMVIEHNRVDDVYVTIPSERKKVKELIEKANEAGMSVSIVPEMFDLLIRETKFTSIGSLTVARLFTPTLNGGEQFIKRLEDLILASLALVILSPLMVVIALAIRLTSPGPIIFKQERLGKGGKPFKFYKFRSMYTGAHNHDTEHREYAKELIKTDKPVDEDKKMYKMIHDKRITPIGRYMRRYGFDEMPQLWNVLKGDMSLIGPRPPLPYEYEEYEEYQKKRLVIKPGITGLWQVSGKSLLSFKQMVMLDVRYINEWSIWLDLKILLETVPFILKGWGGEK